MTNDDLKKLSKRLNILFFDSRLSDLRVRFGDEEDCDGAEGVFLGDEIVIDKYFRNHGDIVSIILLHEMNHADIAKDGYIGYKHDGGHHIRFYSGIDRLYKAGAYEGLL